MIAQNNKKMITEKENRKNANQKNNNLTKL